MSRSDVPAAAFVTVYGSVLMFVLGAIMALDAAVLWGVYHALLRFAGRTYFPERADAYEILQFAVFGALSSAAVYAGLRRAETLGPDRKVLWACYVVSVGAAALLGLGLGSSHLAAGRWNALSPAGLVAAAGLAALKRPPQLFRSGREAAR